MFASHTTILFAVFALSAKVLAGIPPACLLAAVNTQPNPADLKSICNDENSKKIQDDLTSKCGNNVKAALDAFSSTCNDAGVKVATPTVTASSGMPSNSANGTYVLTTQFFNSSCSCTQTSVVTSSRTPSLDTPATACTGSDCESSSGGSGGSGASATGGAGASSTSGSSVAASTGAASAVEQQGALAAAAIAFAGLVAVL
ncbi:MAG: hypothetical protein Q9160_004432 [Pyrenula sp. 1 TL-2023]